MDFRSTSARVILLAALAGMAVTGCKRGNGDEPPPPSSGATSSGSSGAGAESSGGSAAGATGSGGSATVGSAIDDSVITTKLKTALLADTTLKGTDISVETRKGEVVLTGSVISNSQKEHAAQIAQSISGVKSVNNKLTTKK